MTEAVVLFLVGALFLGAAVRGFRARRTGAVRAPGRLTIGVDVLVGTVALADAASSVADHPARLLLWSGGSAALVVACALLVVHSRRLRHGV